MPVISTLAAIGAAVSFGAATGVAAAAIGGAVVGAVVGGVTAAVTKGNVLKGMLVGGLLGAAGGGLAAGLGGGAAVAGEAVGAGTEAASVGAEAASAGAGAATTGAEGIGAALEGSGGLSELGQGIAQAGGVTPFASDAALVVPPLGDVGAAAAGGSVGSSILAATGLNGIKDAAMAIGQGSAQKDLAKLQEQQRQAAVRTTPVAVSGVAANITPNKINIPSTVPQFASNTPKASPIVPVVPALALPMATQVASASALPSATTVSGMDYRNLNPVTGTAPVQQPAAPVVNPQMVPSSAPPAATGLLTTAQGANA